MIECAECGASFTTEVKPSMGDILECQECGIALEVTDTNPLRLEVASENVAHEEGAAPGDPAFEDEEEWLQ